MKVDFPRDSTDDILLLNISPDDETILEGKLKNEADVKVTVILPDDDEVEEEDNEMIVSFSKIVTANILWDNNRNLYPEWCFISHLKHNR